MTLTTARLWTVYSNLPGTSSVSVKLLPSSEGVDVQTEDASTSTSYRTFVSSTLATACHE
jgi:hypothetical protein